jgi:hypothetical protein
MEYNGELENIYPISLNQKKAPDCRFCAFYWHSRTGWMEITELYEDGSEKSFKRVSTFKHGCKQFKINAPSYQLPSLFIYRFIGQHCPVICGPSRKQDAMEKIKR